MVIRQVLARVNDSMHVSLHKIGNNINILVARLLWWFLYVHETDNILVIEELY